MIEKDAPFLQPAIEGLEVEQPEDSSAEEPAINALSRHTGPKTDPYAAERRRQEEINERRGEDLQREQTGVPSVQAEQPDLGDLAATTPKESASPRRKQTTIHDPHKPTYHRPIDENMMTDEHRAAARKHLPGIKEQLARLQSPEDEPKDK